VALPARHPFARLKHVPPTRLVHEPLISLRQREYSDYHRLLLLIFAGLRRVRFLGLGIAMKRLVTPRYRGRTRLYVTGRLTADAPADLFAAQMLAAGEEIRNRLLREKETWMARQVSLLAPSSVSFTTTTPDVTPPSVAITAPVTNVIVGRKGITTRSSTTTGRDSLLPTLWN